MIPNRADLLANDLIWLLSIEYAGRLWRWSSEPITLTDASGDVQQFDGGLEGLDVEQVLPSFGESPDMLSASLDLMWPSDVALLVSQGHDLSAATGELALFVRGSSFDDRYVLIDGNISQPQSSQRMQAMMAGIMTAINTLCPLVAWVNTPQHLVAPRT